MKGSFKTSQNFAQVTQAHTVIDLVGVSSHCENYIIYANVGGYISGKA